jgi:hypothetical protein
MEGDLYIVDFVSFKEESKTEAFSLRPIKTYQIGLRK